MLSILSGLYFQVVQTLFTKKDRLILIQRFFELGIPILGICYGMQLLTHKLGGKVVPAGDAGNREYGQSTLTHTESALLRVLQMSSLS